MLTHVKKGDFFYYRYFTDREDIFGLKPNDSLGLYF